MKIRKMILAAEGDEEQAPTEQTTDPKEIEKLLFQTIEQNVSFLSQSFVLGLSLILLKAGIGTKEELQKIKPNAIINKMYQLVKLITSDRQTVNQELRLLWRYGAQRYAAKKIRELKGAVGNA